MRFVDSRAVPTEAIERILNAGLLDWWNPNPLGQHTRCVTAQNQRMSISVEIVKKERKKEKKKSEALDS